MKPFQKSDVVPAIELAVARFREVRALIAENESLNDRLEARKAIDRAKGVLIDRHSMTESDAFGFIQRSAMSRRDTMRNVAEAIVRGDVLPPA